MTERTDLRAVPLTKFQKVVRTAVSTVVPQVGEEDDVVKSYTERYNCCPPPLFIVLISAVEVCTFLSLSVCLSVSLSVFVCLSVCLLACVCLVISKGHSFLRNTEF